MARILVIDDESYMRFSLCQLLNEAGYQTSEAPNGKVGLELCQKMAFDLVITDLIMPEKEGLETIMALRATEPHIKIIAISGGGTSGLTQFVDVARKLGAHRALYKPLEPQELLSTIHELLSEG